MLQVTQINLFPAPGTEGKLFDTCSLIATSPQQYPQYRIPISSIFWNNWQKRDNNRSKHNVHVVENATALRVPQLDGLRGLAVCLVVLFHYGSKFYDLPLIGPIITHSWIGVDLFFVMSGYLIGGSVLANRNAENFFLVFYIRRSLRIFPLYYSLVLIVVALVSIGLLPEPVHSFLWHAFYQQNILIALTHDYGLVWLQPTWSLAVEEHFYFILPALISFTPPRMFKRVIIGAIAISVISRLFAYAFPLDFPRDFARFFTICRIDCIFYGVLLAEYIGLDPLQMKLQNRLSCVRTLLFFFAIAFAVVAAFDNYVPNEILMSTLGLTLLGPMFLCFLALAISSDGLISRILAIRPLRWIGLRAYAIYLFHMPTLNGMDIAFKHFDIDTHGFTKIFALFATILISYISWWLLEDRLIKIGHGFRYSKSAQHTPSERASSNR